MNQVNTKLFPFTLDSKTMGLTSLWIRHMPKDAATWTSVECQVLSDTSVVFIAYVDWNGDANNQYSMNLRKELLEPHIEFRRQAIVRAVFEEEERMREEQRIAKRKAEIYEELFK
jgi:hypothetical protein